MNTFKKRHWYMEVGIGVFRSHAVFHLVTLICKRPDIVTVASKLVNWTDKSYECIYGDAFMPVKGSTCLAWPTRRGRAIHRQLPYHDKLVMLMKERWHGKWGDDRRTQREVGVEDCTMLSFSVEGGSSVETGPEHPEEDGADLSKFWVMCCTQNIARSNMTCQEGLEQLAIEKRSDVYPDACFVLSWVYLE